MLVLEKVTRFYGTRLIFKDVSLEISAGTVTLLAGANGAGKSTLLKIMAGLIRPCAGTVRYEKPGCTLAFLGHQTFLYPELTAVENLEFWSRLHGSPLSAAQVEDVLQRVGLAPFASEKTKGFSRGMAQRLNLARVLLQEPQLLLLDEPASGLDTRGTAMLHQEIAAAKERGAAVVWITHSVHEDVTRADSVALLENRRLARSCPAQEWSAMGEAKPAYAEIVSDVYKENRP